jgi:DNA gyrase subunit A
VRQVGSDDQVVLITDGGKVIRLDVSTVRITGRNAQGVRLVKLDPGEHVRAVAGLAEPEDVEEGGPTNGANGAASEEESDE